MNHLVICDQVLSLTDVEKIGVYMVNKGEPGEVPAELLVENMQNNAPIVEELLPQTADEKSALDDILKLLFKQEKVDFFHYRQSTVLRRIARRMALCKQESYKKYNEFLQQDSAELKQLHGDLLLYFTEFFRDPQIFEVLKREIFPRLVENRTVKKPIRVWVPGCSTGEEVYSLAIALYEFLEANRLEVVSQFFGTDLVDKHIFKARTAIYPEKIKKHVSKDRLERFFDKTEGGYRVTKHIREMCVFATQDITQDPPFPNIDLLSCRNLLIYFDQTFQDLVIPLFHFSIKSNGFLLLGTSETLGRFPHFFNPVDKRSNIYTKSVLSAKTPYNFPVTSSTFSQKVKSQSEFIERTKTTEFNDLSKQIDLMLLDQYVPPGIVVDSNMNIRQFRGRTSKYLDPASGEASLKLSRMAGNRLMPDVYVAIEEARREKQIIRKRNIPFSKDGDHVLVDIVVNPIRGEHDGELYFLILFEVNEKDLQLHSDQNETQENGLDEQEKELLHLRHDLLATKEYLQTIIEEKDDVNQELWTANEEVQSTNEELQSVNEELEAAKEELESSNEELIALNEELHLKNTELVEVNALNECTISGSLDGILTFDLEMKIKIWNPAMEQMWGITREACLNRELFSLFPFLVDNDQDKVLSSVLEGESAITENQPYHNRQQGTSGFFEGRYSPLRDHSGKIIGGLAVIHDSTDRKLAEEKLVESEERFKMVMQQSPVALEIYDPDGELISINAAQEELWSSCNVTIPERYNILKDRGRWQGDFLDYVREGYEGRTVVIPEYQFQENGEDESGTVMGPRWLSSRIYPLKDGSGNVKNIVISHEDVTARKQAEKDMLKLHKLESIGTLAGGIAHDFNNILMGLFGNLAIAKLELDSEHPAMEHLEDAQKAMSRATRLTKQLVIFAKGGTPIREGVSLGTLVEEVVRFELTGSNIKPVFKTEPDLWVAEVDKGQVQQVFSNLTSNAMQAMEDGGHYYITLENCTVAEKEVAELFAGNYVKITVRDEGEGIDSNAIGQIFDPYFSTKRFGRGLGLATTFSIIKRHGGTIQVESTTGVGSSFILYLPVEGKPSLPSESDSKQDSGAKKTARQGRVLVMDDEAMICKVVTILLENEGYQVETVGAGKEAIQLYKEALETESRFDVVIMDLTIPGGMGGREAVKNILEIDPTANVVVSSGYAEDPVMSNYEDYGFKAIAPKPYDRDTLLQVVRRFL